MASDYDAIRTDNESRYGTDIGRIGPLLLAHRYNDRTHFLFELLQNAEDALARRIEWVGQRSVHFHLTDHGLRVSHFGKPFDEADVRSICGIALSTKDELTAIGRFGIGFKSVYAFTERPEIHSGTEDFAIESFVWPIAAPPLARDDDETVVLIPLKADDTADRLEITTALQRLGAGSVLFLHQIEEIEWRVDTHSSGIYRRSQPENLGDGVRRVSVIGQANGQNDVEENWLVFSKPIVTPKGTNAGHVEIAFSIEQEVVQPGRIRIRPVGRSALVVFFPTALETHLGFLIQGPYRTTPSRDNIPQHDEWNRHCVRETADLLIDALRWLRDHDVLDTGVLRCLPLDPTKFDKATMFARLFEATKQALSSEPLLPRFDGGYVAAKHARLARTQDLRQLFNPSQLAALFGTQHEVAWLHDEITQDRTPELRRYIMQELATAEVTPETIIPKLTSSFLQSQPDSWILELYRFLNGQPALRSRLDGVPLIRLEDGSHVLPKVNKQVQAFLPGKIKTGFPTVRASVCATEISREFLRSLGLTEPDPVDDVIRNVLPRYREEKVDVNDTTYETDIDRILTAFGTDSKTQREKLLAALRVARFVRASDADDGAKQWALPGNVHLATDRLKELFSGVHGILFVDDSYACLRGETVRGLLEAAGATRYLRPIPVWPRFTSAQRREMRIAAGCETNTADEEFDDYTLRGLSELIDSLPKLNTAGRARKAELLWNALGDVETRHGASIFIGTYRWFYYTYRRASFTATFIETLNNTSWVPDANGELQRPEFVVFETLGWEANPFLLSKIHFKPRIIETLAKEAGIEPGVLDLLKKYNITSESELKARLGIQGGPPQPVGNTGPESVRDALKNLIGDVPEPTPPVSESTELQPLGLGTREGHINGADNGTGAGAGTVGGARGDDRTDDRIPSIGTGKRTPGSTSSRQFISYVGVHQDEDDPDSDGLDQPARMALEEKAIQLILEGEPQLQRTPTHNPGYDLFEAGEDGQPARWIEVKAMTGSLTDRPVGLSRTQFDCARQHKELYWLYVVEQAGNLSDARIVCIQDPASRARTFTFDHGWLSIAEVHSVVQKNGEQDREK